MAIEVLFLGTGSVVPERGRHCASLLLRIGGERVLCDAGPGALHQLVLAGERQPHRSLDRIFLTHFHPDHCADLVAILFAMRLPNPARTAPLTIYGPRGLRALVQRLNRAFSGWLEPRTYPLELRELDEDVVRLGRYRVRTRRMNHSARAIGYRFESEGCVVTYSGDTDAGPGIEALGRGADVLILECSTTDERRAAGHLAPTACGELAARCGCRHLALTHFFPVLGGYNIAARVRRQFPGRLTLARDLLRLRLPPKRLP